MGESDRSHRNERPQYKHRKYFFGADNNAVFTLFAINIILFLILMMIQVGVYAGEHDQAYFFENVLRYFQLPASLHEFSEQPWALLTYMFTHSGAQLIMMLSNFVWLWAFGSLMQQLSGNDKIIPVYIYGGLTGALFFVLAAYFIPALAPFRSTMGLMGANAAVIAVAMAATTLSPGFKFFRQLGGGIPIWVLMAAYLLIDILSVRNLNAAFALSHLGGAIAGFVFVLLMRKGIDGSVWMNKFWRKFISLFDPKPANAGSQQHYRSDRKAFDRKTNLTAQRLDAILDKINEKGYHFLTDEEKEFLNRASKE